MAPGCSPAFPARPRRHRAPRLKLPDFLLPGAKVEVRRDEEGYYGAWWQCEATIEDDVEPSSAPAGRAVVTFEGSNRQSTIPFSQVRPRPPPSLQSARSCFRPYEIVEACHERHSWWSGIVLSAEPNAVTVGFPITRDVVSYMPHLVRPRRDFVDRQWLPSNSKVAVAVRPNRPVVVYKVGDKVDVVRNRMKVEAVRKGKVFGKSWLPATVRYVVDDLSYVVEYLDVDEEGQKVVTEYLYWKFIRPAVQLQESELLLVPGAAVEAFCDGAWSLGVVRRVLGEGKYEIGIVPEESEPEQQLVTKVASLLRLHHEWDGKQWMIATTERRSVSGKCLRSAVEVSSSDEEDNLVQRQANSRRRTVCGKSPRSLVEVSSSAEEHNLGNNTLAEGSEHASVSEMDNPLSALCKSPERTHSPNSFVSEKNCPQGSHGIVNLVPMNGLLCASSGITNCIIEPKGNGDLSTEAMHVSKELPQQQYFLPLQKFAPGPCEGMASGMLVPFTDLVNNITMEADLDKSMEWYKDQIKTFSHLEKNAQFMQNALSNLVKLKSKHTSYHGEISKLDLKIENKKALSSGLHAQLDEKERVAAKLEQELKCIRQESQKIALDIEEIDAEAASMETTRSGFEDLRSGVESEFGAAVSALGRNMLS